MKIKEITSITNKSPANVRFSCDEYKRQKIVKLLNILRRDLVFNYERIFEIINNIEIDQQDSSEYIIGHFLYNVACVLWFIQKFYKTLHGDDFYAKEFSLNFVNYLIHTFENLYEIFKNEKDNYFILKLSMDNKKDNKLILDIIKFYCESKNPFIFVYQFDDYIFNSLKLYDKIEY